MNLRALLGTKDLSLRTIHAEAGVPEAIRLMVEQNAPALIVVGRGEPLGLLTERDLLQSCLKASGMRLEELRAADAMKSGWITADIDDDLGSALARALPSGMKCLPVVEAGKLVGMIPLHDLVRHRLEELTAELDMLHEYLASLQDAIRD